MSSLYNRARVNTATAGTGTVTLGAVTSNAFFTFAEAGVPDGTVVSYVIEDGSNVEIGVGTYTSCGTSLSRTTVTASKISGTAGTTKLTLSGSAIVYIDALAADITVPPASSTDKAIVTYNGTTGRAIQDNPAVTLDASGNLSITQNLNAAALGFVTNSNAGGSSAAGFGASTPGAGFTLKSFSAAASTYMSADTGAFLTGTTTANLYYMFTNNTVRALIDQNGSMSIGASVVPDRLFHIEQDNAATNTVSYLQRLTSTSSGTPASGIGVGVEFEAEAQAGVNKVGGTIENYAYNVGAGTEGFEFVFKTMSAGAAATEKGRTGFMPVNMIQNDNLTLLASNSVVVSSQYTIPIGLTLTLAANSVMRIL